MPRWVDEAAVQGLVDDELERMAPQMPPTHGELLRHLLWDTRGNWNRNALSVPCERHHVPKGVPCTASGEMPGQLVCDHRGRAGWDRFDRIGMAWLYSILAVGAVAIIATLTLVVVR